MSRFHSLDRVLARDENFREFFTTLTGIASGHHHRNGASTTNMGVAGGSDDAVAGNAGSDATPATIPNGPLMDRILAHDGSFHDLLTTLNGLTSGHGHLNGTNWADMLFGGGHHAPGSGDMGGQDANPPPVTNPAPVTDPLPVNDPAPGTTHTAPVTDPLPVNDPAPGATHTAPVTDPPPATDPAPGTTHTTPVTPDPVPVTDPTPVNNTPPVVDPAPAAAATLSADWATANTDAGPYWAMNSTWNAGNLVNGTDFSQSLTMENPNSPNTNTTISWNWPDTPAGYNVYSYPAVFYGDYAGFNSPATSVTAEQVDNIKTLTLSQNVTLSGQTDQYDAMYDGYLTSTPDGGSSAIQHEIEVYVHQPSYVQDWIQNLPQHSFTDVQGTQWTIANSGNIVIFAPTNGQDLTNSTIDLKGLLQAAAADGLISGHEYFDGIALGNEPREGSGSMTIHSFAVNYDGDPNHASGTGGTQSAGTNPPPATDPAPVSHSQPAGNSNPVTSPSPVTSSSAATGAAQGTSNAHYQNDVASSGTQSSGSHEHIAFDAMSLAHQVHTYEHMWG